MSMRRYCSAPGCTVIVEHGRCPAHDARLQFRSATPYVNYGRKWRRESQAFLADHIWCVLCPPGSTTLATEVDHIEPHRGDARLFWDRTNWQALCKRCHNRKTARETLRQ